MCWLQYVGSVIIFLAIVGVASSLTVFRAAAERYPTRTVSTHVFWWVLVFAVGALFWVT